MDKTNLELFKQALSEGLDNRFQSEIDNCSENIVCSRKHKIAMKAIIKGCDTNRKVWAPRTRKIVAILVAAALLLVSCAIIYRNEIRDFIEEIYESFAIVTYSEGENKETTLEEIYELTYIPEGYILQKSEIASIVSRAVFSNSSGDTILFDQCILDSSNFYIDVENGYTLVMEIENPEVYYKNAQNRHYYIWNDGKYAMTFISTFELPTEELQLMINNVKIK